MGDSGSQVLGFAVAALGLAASWTAAGAGVATILLPVLVLAVPILDTTLVTIVRLLEGRPVTQGGRDHTSHRLVYQGLSDTRAVVMLAVVSAALGATALAYKVLDNTLTTLAGVLVTFAFLVQFGSYLADVNRGGEADSAAGIVRSLIVHRRRFVEVRRRLRADHGLVHDRVHHPGARHGLRHLPPRLRHDAAGAARRGPLPRLHPVRPLPRRVAVRGRGGRSPDLRRDGRLGGSRVPLHLGHRRLAPLPARHVPDRSPALHVPDRRGAVLGARRRARHLRRSSAAQSRRRVAHRRRRAERPEPAARAARDAGRAGRRVRRRRSRAAPAPHPGRHGRGGLDEIGWALGRLAPDAVLVTIPDAPHERLDGVVEACARAGVPARFVRREIDIDPQSSSAPHSSEHRRPDTDRGARPRSRQRRAPARDRLLAVVPLASVYVWLCIVYIVEVWARVTPWLFTDELKTTQLSRSIADTGHAAERGAAHSLHSLYTS